MRRVLARNADMNAAYAPAQATSEQYSLFRGYVDSRHSDGGMADMSVLDFSMMVEDSHVETRLVEYRRPGAGGRHGLMACPLNDVLAHCLSMRASLAIEAARALGLPHVYLGYWVEGSKKMGYKSRFLPQERLGMNGWELTV